jgi:SAM-dependent methyltransferase
MTFQCNICRSNQIGKRMLRGDGERVVFCQKCGMGSVENPPERTAIFYDDSYYGGNAQGHGYADYQVSAEHSLLWVRLMVEAIRDSGRVLDIGCADGFLLSHLRGNYELFGIEANKGASKQAAAKGITILSDDLFTALQGAVSPFDIITSIATFEHVLDFRRAFEISLIAMTPDGVLIFEVPLMSETEDNRDWIDGSYEHIFYPTVTGMERLFIELPALCFGFESKLQGFGSTYIGFATRDQQTFQRVQSLFSAMASDSLEGLLQVERRLNLAHHLVHGFKPTVARVAAMPELASVADSKELMRQVLRLWLADSMQAAQSANWKAAYDELLKATTPVTPPKGGLPRALLNFVKRALP